MAIFKGPTFYQVLLAFVNPKDGYPGLWYKWSFSSKTFGPWVSLQIQLEWWVYGDIVCIVQWAFLFSKNDLLMLF